MKEWLSEYNDVLLLAVQKGIRVHQTQEDNWMMDRQETFELSKDGRKEFIIVTPDCDELRTRLEFQKKIEALTGEECASCRL